MNALPLVAGVVLSVVGGVVRIRAWHGAMAAVAPEVRYRDVVVAHLGGMGFNGLVPAKGGDALKVALVKRRTPETPFGRLIGSLAPPAACEALVTAFVLAWALWSGLLGTPSLPGQIPLPLVGAALAIAAGVLWLLAKRAPKLLRDVKSGMGALRRPRELFTHVAPWVVCARLFRLAALGCFLAAVGLPVTVAGVVLLMAIQGGVGSTGPASTPVRLAVLMAAMPAALGVGEISMETGAKLIGATQVAVMGTNLAISLVVLGAILRTASPRRVIGYCREHIAAARARA